MVLSPERSYTGFTFGCALIFGHLGAPADSGLGGLYDSHSDGWHWIIFSSHSPSGDFVLSIYTFLSALALACLYGEWMCVWCRMYSTRCVLYCAVCQFTDICWVLAVI